MPQRIRPLVVTHSLSVGVAERFAANLLTSLPRERFAPAVCLVTVSLICVAFAGWLMRLVIRAPTRLKFFPP